MSSLNNHSTGYGPSASQRLYFTGDMNIYDIWETRFLAHLYTQNELVHEAILPKGEADNHKDFEKSNKRAFAELVQFIDERSLQLIMRDAKDNGREALRILRSHYVSTEKPRILTLYEQLTTIQMTDTEDITGYLIRAENYATGLKSAKETISDNLIKAMILKGLPESYQPFIVVHTQLDKTQTFTEFKSALTNFDQQHRQQSTTAMTARGSQRNHQPARTSSHQQQLNRPHKSQTQICQSCGKKGHNSSDCYSKGRLKCGHCHLNGHVEVVCRRKKRDQQQHSTPEDTAKTSQSANSFAFKVDADNCNTTADSKINVNTLMVDCGATSHVVNNKSAFISYDDSFVAKRHFIELADGHQTNQVVQAKGTAQYTVMDSNNEPQTILLQDALLAPCFPHSLFSVRAATAKGASVTFTPESNKLTAGNTDFPIQTRDRLFFLQTETKEQNSACLTKSLNEWHIALGHSNYDDIIKLQHVTEGMKISDVKGPQQCVTCLESKSTKQTHSQDEQQPKATKPLQRVHSDVCGPISPQSRGGHHYMINFIDEYSSMMFTYPLRHKSDSHTALKQLLADVAPIGRIKEIHTDNGGEYTSSKFLEVLRDNSIRHSTTAPHSSYQNGKVERSWRTLMETSRSILHGTQLPMNLWPYSLKYSQYIRNRSYQRRTKSTAYELFTNQKPDMRKIYPFGSTCIYHQEGAVPKLQDRGKQGIYLGVEPKSRSYVILTDKNTIVVSRNVTVIQSQTDSVTPQEPANHSRYDAPDVMPQVPAGRSGESCGDVVTQEPTVKHRCDAPDITPQGPVPGGNDTPTQKPTINRSRDVTTQEPTDKHRCDAPDITPQGPVPGGSDTRTQNPTTNTSCDVATQEPTAKHRCDAPDITPQGPVPGGSDTRKNGEAVPSTNQTITPQGPAGNTRSRTAHKSQTNQKKPARFNDLILSVNHDYAYSMTPRTFEEAMESADKQHWKTAMDTEIATLNDNTTWSVETLPPGKSETKGRWVYAIKQGADDTIKYKARYVAKGYSQKYGIDYDETFSPTTRFTSIRTLLQKAANESLLLHQLDVKGAYLNAPIDKEIYLQQPPGYETDDDRGNRLSCRLHKSIYGLKQSGRNWHHTLTDFLKSEGFTANESDCCIYTKDDQHNQITILFWVDDIIIACKDMTMINNTKEILHKRFKMDDRGELKWFLGIDFSRNSDGHYTMSQTRYTEDILRKFGMEPCKPTPTPAEKNLQLKQATAEENSKIEDYPYRQIIGSLMYLMTATRPDICWTVSKLSQFLDQPGPEHVTALKHLLRYLQGTKTINLTFTPNKGHLQGYTDSDWASDEESRRSTTGYIFTFGGTPISWRTRKQPTVALSSCEAEYMAMTEAVKEMIHLRQFCTSLGMIQPQQTIIHCDNQGAIALTTKRPGQLNRTKHIDVRHHFIREREDTEYLYIPSTSNLADILTKPLGRCQHMHLIGLMGISIEGAY